VRILIVEDDFYSRDMLEVMLGMDGHEVVSAGNGEEGWAAFQKKNFAVVISDWLMPETDGLELCRRIRAFETARYSYVILLTALKGKSNYLEAMRAGADDFVSKPYDHDELRARLLVAERIVGLQDRVKRLEGVLPTCMYCKKIRDEASNWVHIEQYITERTQASFSHGVCPDCYHKVVKPEIDRIRPA
jgi:sigma-B regulation protein RsbU (phosphoserine phosphatase)